MSRAWIPDVPRHLSQFLYASRWIGGLFLLLAHAAIMVMNTGVMASFPKPVIFLQSLLFGPEFCIAIVNGLLVTSGFLVGGSVLAAVLEGRRFLSDYLIHRFARTYLVLVPAILLTCGFDGAGSVVPDAVPVYANEEFGGHWAPGVVLATLFNLQGIGADYLGTNGHLWIFAYDFWFCTLFALALLPWAKPYSRFARAAGFTVAVTLFALLSFPRGLYLGLLFVVFALGAAATLPARPFVRSFERAGPAALHRRRLCASARRSRGDARDVVLAAQRLEARFCDELRQSAFDVALLRREWLALLDGADAQASRWILLHALRDLHADHHVFARLYLFLSGIELARAAGRRRASPRAAWRHVGRDLRLHWRLAANRGQDRAGAALAAPPRGSAGRSTRLVARRPGG